MHLLVTGGAGYIGSVLVPMLLGDGHRVRVLDSLLHGGESLLGVWGHPAFEFLRGDLRGKADRESALNGVEAVIHLAAIVGDPACGREPDTARAVNLDASLALITESRRRGVGRFLFASTCSNYGKMPDPDGLVDESSELRPVSLYAQTKVAVETALLAQEPGDESFCPTPLRFATVYGVSPRMRFDLTVNEFAAELAAGRRLVVFGQQFWRPYVHVIDVARAILTVLKAPVGNVRRQVFNVGCTQENYQKEQIVNLIRGMIPEAQVEYVRRVEDPRDYRVSCEGIRRVLGFEVTRRLKDGVREVAALVRSGVIRDIDDQRYRN